MNDEKRALRVMLSDRAIAYHSTFAKIMGSVAGGVWLSQLMYHDSLAELYAKRDGKNYDGWFDVSDAEMIEEAHLSKRECTSSKKYAKELGIVNYELRGMPRKTQFNVNIEKLTELIAKCGETTTTKNGVTKQQVAHHRATGSAPSRNKLHTIAQQVGTNPLVKSTPDALEMSSEMLSENIASSTPRESASPEKPEPEQKKTLTPDEEWAYIKSIDADKKEGDYLYVTAFVMSRVLGHQGKPSSREFKAAKQLWDEEAGKPIIPASRIIEWGEVAKCDDKYQGKIKTKKGYETWNGFFLATEIDVWRAEGYPSPVPVAAPAKPPKQKEVIYTAEEWAEIERQRESERVAA